MSGGSAPVSLTSVEEARARIASAVATTPVLWPAKLAEELGAPVALKAESLQHTGSFKVRGVFNKLASLERDGGATAVTAGSAGNHGQAVAYAARRHGLASTIHVPETAAIAKLEGIRSWGASTVAVAGGVDECVAEARSFAESSGATFIHPFDDPDVVAGQGTLGLELLEQVPSLKRVVVPVGGGGLGAGVAVALKETDPGIEVVGVQSADCAPLARPGEPPGDLRFSLADGIAVKQPGGLTTEILDRLMDELVTVAEGEIADAMIYLLRECRLLVEGAGAAALAILLAGELPRPEGTTVAILSGGNADLSLLSSLIGHEEAVRGRRVRLSTRVPDRPGGMAGLLAAVAETGADVVEIDHVRDLAELRVRETGVVLTLQVRDAQHLREVLGELGARGYPTSEHA